MKKYILYFAILVLPLRNIVEKIPSIGDIEGLGFMNVLFLSLLFLCISPRNAQTQNNVKVDFISLPLSLYLIYFLLLVVIPLNSYTSTFSRFIFWKDILIGFSFYFVILRFDLSKRDILIILIIMVVSNIYMDTYFWRWVRWMNFASFDDRLKTVNGTFGNMCGPNAWAAFFAVYSMVIFSVVKAGIKKRIIKILLVVLLICNVFVLLFSFSRGAYLAVIGGLIWFCWKEKKIFLLLTLVVFLIFYEAILPEAVIDRINMTQTSEGQLDSDAESRIVMWEYAFRNYESSWLFGNGLLSFNFLYPGSTVVFNNPHNNYLHLFYEGGVVGCMLFVWILISSYRQGIYLFRNSRDKLSRSIGLGTAVAVISLALVNIFGNRWTYMCLIGYFWVIMAVNSRLIQIESVNKNS